MRRLKWARSGCFCAVLIGAVLAQQPLRAANEPLSGVQLEAAIADYKVKLEDYTRLRQAYDQEAKAYWASVADKRRARNGKRRGQQPIVLTDYVLTQPPVYLGPPEPINPVSPPPGLPPPRRVIPVVSDFLQAALGQFDFQPQMPKIEIEYKRAYAEVAAAAGLTKEQAVRIYGFESGGNGCYDVQAGLEYPRPNPQAISTALGYNQLLSTNSVELLAEQGDRFVAAMTAKVAVANGPRKRQLERKLAVLKRMIAVSRSVPDEWGEHEKLGRTPQGLAIHALNLDIDIGPLLQTQKLLDSVEFARRKGIARPLTAAELEMMNLTGDGNGFDMVSMPDDLRGQVPTANFFQPNGYAANRVAAVNDTVAKLLKATDIKMDKEAELPGARELASVFP